MYFRGNKCRGVRRVREPRIWTSHQCQIVKMPCWLSLLHPDFSTPKTCTCFQHWPSGAPPTSGLRFCSVHDSFMLWHSQTYTVSLLWARGFACAISEQFTIELTSHQEPRLPQEAGVNYWNTLSWHTAVSDVLSVNLQMWCHPPTAETTIHTWPMLSEDSQLSTSRSALVESMHLLLRIFYMMGDAESQSELDAAMYLSLLKCLLTLYIFRHLHIVQCPGCSSKQW